MRAAARLAQGAKLVVSTSPCPGLVPLLGFRLAVAAYVKYFSLVKFSLLCWHCHFQVP